MKKAILIKKGIMKLFILSVLFTLLMGVPRVGAVASSMFQNLTCKGNACVLRLSWLTESTAGTFTGFTTMEVNGWIDGVETDPGATAPTDNYDVSIANYVVSEA